MNDTIPPLATKLVRWLQQPGVMESDQRRLESCVAEMISDHVPIDAMVKERTAYRDLLRRLYWDGLPLWMDESIEKVFADMGETLDKDV